MIVVKIANWEITMKANKTKCKLTNDYEQHKNNETSSNQMGILFLIALNNLIITKILAPICI